MSYYFSKTIDDDFDSTMLKITEELRKEGFGILTEINVTDIFRQKLDVDFRRYKILGACNPNFAYESLKEEDKIGVMLPCNVIVQEHEDGKTEVAAVDPVASMMAVENTSLTETATTVREKLKNVIERL